MHELTSFRESMNRIFDEAFSRLPSLGSSREMKWWQPLVDVVERENEILVRANLPGIDPKDVEVTVSENMINIKGEARQENEEQDANFYCKERYYGAFQRSIPLDVKVKADDARAAFKNGVLEIVAPKEEGSGGKRVQVKVE